MLSRAILDLLFPRLCVLCGKKGADVTDLCPEHEFALKPFPGAGCPRCGRSFAAPIAAAGPEARRCPQCAGMPPGFLQASGALQYPGTGRELLLAWKLQRRREAMFPLLRAALEKLRDLQDAERRAGKRGPWSAIEAVTFVPLHRKKRRERGFNQAEDLAREIALEMKIPFRALLVRTRATSPQASGADANARRQNVHEAFGLRKRLAWPVRARPLPRTLLLIDDVFTSGATAQECARVLRAAGVRRVLVLTALRGGDGMVSSSIR